MVSNGYYDEIGGYHCESIGWSPYGVFCGECTSISCKGCDNIEKSFKASKKESIKAAKELGYTHDVIERIKNAENDHEITRILITARKAEND